MKRIIGIILILLCIFYIVVIANPDSDIDRNKEQDSETLYTKADEIDIPEDSYSYKIESKVQVEEGQLETITKKIDEIYEYFRGKNYETKQVKIIITSFSRVEADKSRIFIDTIINDIELMKLIIQYEFSEKINYGLMYGLMFDISKNCEIEFEDVRTFTIEELYDVMDYMYLSYINFNPVFASEMEIEMSKYISIEIVQFVQNRYGTDSLFDLMKNSADALNVKLVRNVLYEWLNVNNSSYKPNIEHEPLVFKLNSKEDVLEYQSRNINWILNLDKEEAHTDYFPSVHNDTKTFYEYSDLMFEEISRLEEMLDFSSNDLPMVTIELYSKDIGKNGGMYLNYSGVIKLNSLMSFSHEYVHFYDFSKGYELTYSALKEMRAGYYSNGYILNKIATDELLENTKEYYNALNYIELDMVNPVVEVENYLDRDLTHSDFYSLFADVLLHLHIGDDGEIPDLFEVGVEGYPVIWWNSLMGYMTRTYGAESVDSIMIEQKLLDGTNKDITHVIEEWLDYMNNLSEADYDNYY